MCVRAVLSVSFYMVCHRYQYQIQIEALKSNRLRSAQRDFPRGLPVYESQVDFNVINIKQMVFLMENITTKCLTTYRT